MVTVRLDEEMEALLDSFCQRKGLSKSAVIKEALALYIRGEKSNKSPFELGADLFGAASGGDTDASINYKKLLKEKLHDHKINKIASIDSDFYIYRNIKNQYLSNVFFINEE